MWYSLLQASIPNKTDKAFRSGLSLLDTINAICYNNLLERIMGV